MTGQELAGLLDARQTAPDQWIAKCPAHPDRNPSLGIRQVEDRVLLRCWAGCSTEAVMAALDLRMSDLFDDDRNDQNRQFRTPRKQTPDRRTPEQKLADALLADAPRRTPKEALTWAGIDELHARNKMITRAERLLKDDPDSELGWALLAEGHFGYAEIEHELNCLEGRKE